MQDFDGFCPPWQPDYGPFCCKAIPPIIGQFQLKDWFFSPHFPKSIWTTELKKNQKSCKSGMLSLHFLGFQVELVTEMAIPLLLGFRLLSQMSSCSHCWGTVGKIYEPLPVKRAMWLSEFVLNDLKQNVYSKSFGTYWGCSGCRSFQVFQS